MPPSYSPCPRPCLKRSPASPLSPAPHDEPSTLLAIDPSILSPLVRFPPQPSLTHTIGSALHYDRSPIVVLPNRCALPERGCPGRTYAPEEASSPLSRRIKRSNLSPTRAKHLHPRAADERHLDDDRTPRQSPRDDHPPLPALVPDLSSESSEESDGFASPLPDLYHASSSYGKLSLEQSLMSLSLAGTNAPSTSALSFLPHPPSPRVRPYHASLTTSPSHSSSNSRTTSPVRSRSPSSPTHRRKHRPQPIPVPAPNPAFHSYSLPSPSPSYIPMSPSAPMVVPASPERERRSRHRDDRDRRDRSRERKDQERAARLARYTSLADPTSRPSGFGYDDSGCLGGF